MRKFLMMMAIVLIAKTELMAQTAPAPVSSYDGSAPPAPMAPMASAGAVASDSNCQLCDDPNCRRCRRGNRPCHLDHVTCCIGTCNLYQHYAYRPEYFGYYYYRPYNYVTVFEQKAEAGRIGGDPLNPYSIKMLDAIYAQFTISAPPLPPLEGTAKPLGSKLPQLEDLLEPASAPAPGL